jgi:DNA-binding winged helix-turn-helix (wHTH) protein
MGKQSKIKKIRKQQSTPSQTPTTENSDRDRFIQNIEKQGYSFKQSQHAPEVPTKKVDPQL